MFYRNAEHCDGKRIERSFGFSLFSCPFSDFSGTFDYMTFFEQNYDRNFKEVNKCENRRITQRWTDMSVGLS